MTRKPEIVLASASPRRRELLAGMGVPFTVVPADIDEDPWVNESPISYALRVASDKAREVQRRIGPRSRAIILAADTVVVVDGRILGKPGDVGDAKAMLRALSGRAHEVITGLCLLRERRETGDAVRTTVVFREITEDEIAGYVAGGEPMDKAGAYAIQGGAAKFVTDVRGSYSNVVGLPVERLAELLQRSLD
jgi:septum formation protein